MTTPAFRTALLAALDADGASFVVNNGGASAPVPADQGSVRFAGDAAGAWLDRVIGGTNPIGHANLTLAALVYLENRVEFGSILEVGHLTNGRYAGIMHDNTFENELPVVSDSDTGWGGSSAGWTGNPPPLNTWLYMTFRGSTDGTTFYGTWTTAEGEAGTVYIVNKPNNIWGVQAQRIVLNGGSPGHGSAQGLNIRYQYVRGRTGYLSDAVVNAGFNNPDVVTDGWEFWWVFADDGIGGVTVTDATGNGRVPTIVGGTFATGPVVVGVV